MLASRRPYCGVSGAEYRDRGDAGDRGQVRYARIVSDIGGAFREHGREAPERQVMRDYAPKCVGEPSSAFHQPLVSRPQNQQNLTVHLAFESFREQFESLYRPTFALAPAARMDRHYRPSLHPVPLEESVGLRNLFLLKAKEGCRLIPCRATAGIIRLRVFERCRAFRRSMRIPTLIQQGHDRFKKVSAGMDPFACRRKR
jgi:hypothetical protein